MSITTYAELKTAVSSWVHRSDLSANLDDLVTAGEKWIMRKVRAPEMETALSVAISTTTGLATVPTGFLGLKYAYVDGSPTQPLEVRSPQQIFNRFPTRSSDSKPEWIGYDAGSFLFGPFPDSGYTVKGTYYKRQGPLSSAVYDLFSNNPDLFLFAALAETEPFIKNDKRVALWIAKRDAITKDINDEAVGILGAGGLSMITA
jgi:hypothetical protein